MKYLRSLGWLSSLMLLTIAFWTMSCGSGGKGKKSDWVIVHQLADPEMLHPSNSSDAAASYINDYLLYQTMLRFNRKTLEIEPCLAIARPKITESDKGILYEYEIHPKATWDDGKPITGHDVAFSLKSVLNPKVDCAHLRPYLEFVHDIEVDATNPKKFVVIAKEKYFLAESSFGTDLHIIPKHLYDPKGLMDNITLPFLKTEKDKAAADANVVAFATEFNQVKYQREKEFIFGSGPYKLDEWVTDQKIVLVKKENWWADELKDVAYENEPSKIIFKTIKDLNTAETALKKGEIDVFYGIPADKYQNFLENDKIKENFNLSTPPQYAYQYIGMNMRPKNREPLFTDKKVRRAMAHLVNVEHIIKKISFNTAVPVLGPISPLKKNAYNTDLKALAYDIKLAAQILDEAGWKDSNNNGTRDKVVNGKLVEMKFEIAINQGNETRKEIATLMRDAAKQIGVEINIQSYEWSVFLEKLDKKDFDMYVGGWVASPSPDDLKQIWHTSMWEQKGSNYVGFGNSETDKMIDQIRQELDETKRNELYKKFQEIIYDEQPYIFIASPLNRIAIHNRFGNAETTALRPGYHAQGFTLTQ